MAAKFKARTADTHAQHIEDLELAANWHDVLLIGASNFERLGKTHEFSQFANRHKVFCAGIGGDRVCHMNWRLTKAPRLLEQVVQPKLVVLMAGTNDIEDTPSPAALAKGVQNLVWEIKERFGWKNTRVALMGLLPRRPGQHLGQSENEQDKNARALAAKIKQTNLLLEKLDYIDSFEDFGPQFSEPDGSLREDFFRADGVHLNFDGYRHFLFGLDAVVQDLLARPWPKKGRGGANKT